MKHFVYRLFVTLLCLCGSYSYCQAEEWIDVTDKYLTNTSFVNNSNSGWTYSYQRGTSTVRCETMEFWNATYDIYQAPILPAGRYRMSVQSYFRTADDSQAYRNYQMGRENITGVMYAGSTSQKLVSVYTFGFDSWVDGTNFHNGKYYPNTMESASVAFAQDAYWNQMEFTTDGGNVNIGLKNETWTSGNWCIFDNFKLEYWGTVIQATSLTLSPTSPNLVIGESLQLQITFRPTDVTYTKLTWKSSNEAIATVDENGLITATGAGTTYITAKTTDGSNITRAVRVTVSKGTPTAESLVVNEVMASNYDLFISPSWNFDGWIELYNPSNATVSLADIYISDDPANLTKWQAPSYMGIIPPNGFKTIWFDHSNLSNYQPSFNLDVDGGTIYISDPDGQLITSQTYPAAIGRIAYARTTDGGEQWGLTSTPTPDESNANATFATMQLPDPVVDVDSKLFTGTLNIKVTIPEGATLYYTKDGTLPTPENGKLNTTGDFSITSTRCYRFRLFQDGMLPSNPVSRSYIYKDKDYSLPIVSVISDPDFLYDDSIGVYVQGVNGRPGNGQRGKCNWNMDWERPVNFSYVLEDGTTMALNQDVYLEMCGGWSRAWEPHSFKLKGNKALGGNKNLNYKFFSAKPWIRNRTLQIRNGGNDNYCRIKDPAIQTIIQTSGIDIDCQSYQPVHEFINGQYIGVLNVREPNNKHYVYANYGWDDDEIDQFEISPDSGYVQKCGTDEQFNRIYELSASAADSATYAQIKELVDMDEFINYHAAEFYLGPGDWARNNVKGFTKRPDGKLRLVFFDIDSAFGFGSNVFTEFERRQICTFDELFGCPVKYITAELKLITIFLNLLNNDEFRKQFIDTYCVMGGSVFTPERCNTIIDSLTTRVAPAMALTNESPYSTANSIKSSFNGRLSTMMNAIKNYSRMQLSNTTMQGAIIESNVEGAKLFINNTNIPTGSFNGNLFAPVTLKALSPAGYTFKGWRDENSQQYYSTEAEVEMPDGDFHLTAVFEEMTEREKSTRGITPVRINEVSANNSVFVNDYFKKNDWVELVNTTDEPQDVEGMYLTDNLSKPTKYQITKESTDANTIIPAHGHLLIWCDKLSTMDELHASFKLAAEGGEMQLMAADESWKDRFAYPEHNGNQSVGRYPDGTNDIFLFEIPTIGATNRTSSYASITNDILLGDVNGDGLVNIADVVCLVNYILTNDETGIILANADLNGDQSINISDAVALVNLILGMD
ncbi:MAG: CotH kinase family protein [Prevotella sp.]|nr:CotH kinase family protein [Prevotella sp.]